MVGVVVGVPSPVVAAVVVLLLAPAAAADAVAPTGNLAFKSCTDAAAFCENSCADCRNDAPKAVKRPNPPPPPLPLPLAALVLLLLLFVFV